MRHAKLLVVLVGLAIGQVTAVPVPRLSVIQSLHIPNPFKLFKTGSGVGSSPKGLEGGSTHLRGLGAEGGGGWAGRPHPLPLPPPGTGHPLPLPPPGAALRPQGSPPPTYDHAILFPPPRPGHVPMPSIPSGSYPLMPPPAGSLAATGSHAHTPPIRPQAMPAVSHPLPLPPKKKPTYSRYEQHPLPEPKHGPHP